MTKSNKIPRSFHTAVASFFLWCVAAGSFAEGEGQSAGLFDVIIPLSSNLDHAEDLDKELGPDAAYQYLNSLPALAPSSEERLMNAQAAYAWKAGHFKEAERLYRALINSSPNNYFNYSNLGNMLLAHTDRIVEAGLFLEKATELAPEHPLMMAQFGSALHRQGNLKKALEVTGKAVHLMENSPQAQELLVAVGPFTGNHDSETWGKIQILARYGELLWESGSEEKASKIWCDALRMDINNRDSNATLSEILSRLGLESKIHCW